MKHFIEKLIGRLEEEKFKALDSTGFRLEVVGFSTVHRIADQLAEGYNNGWIPCSERLPEEHDSIFAKFKNTDKWNAAMFEKISDDVNVTIEYEDGKRRTTTLHTTDGKWRSNSIVNFKVIAWQPLPEPCQED